MITLDGLCDLTAGLSTTSEPLRQACARPRSPADTCFLPEPGAEFFFDSSWEAISTGTDVVGKSVRQSVEEAR